MFHKLIGGNFFLVSSCKKMSGCKEKAEVKLLKGLAFDFWLNLVLTFIFFSYSSVLSVHTPTLFHRRLRDSVPWPGQRWKPWSPWRLPLSNWGRQSPVRASGKPHRPSLLHAELLLHLLTLINSHPFPYCSTFHLRDAANGVCPSTCPWDHSPWKCLCPNTLLSFYHRPKSSQVKHSHNTSLQQIRIMFPLSYPR